MNKTIEELKQEMEGKFSNIFFVSFFIISVCFFIYIKILDFEIGELKEEIKTIKIELKEGSENERN